MTESEVMALATFENPVICKAGNKIEFKDGTCLQFVSLRRNGTR